MNKSEKIDYVSELFSANFHLDHWVYSMVDGHLLSSNSSNERILDVILSNGEVKPYLLEYCKDNHMPLIISSTLGNMWAALFDLETPEYPRCHILGPVFTNAISMQNINERIDIYPIPMNWKRPFQKLVIQFPVVSWNVMSQLILMMHYTLTGESISESEFVYAPNLENNGESPKSKKSSDISDSKGLTWQTEQALLNNVRTGNLNYKSALNDAINVSSGVESSIGNPVRRYQDSGIVFAALCARAAIEGGLSPAVAYHLQNLYSQEITAAKTLSEIASINHQMYEDFIHRVHSSSIPSTVSAPIAQCINYITLHLDEPLNVHDLAHHFGYSDYYLTRKFKQETGMRIGNYIKKQRILRAKTLLETTDLAIQEISDSLLFSSRAYFTSCFIEEAGMPPTEYRQKFSH